MVYLILSLWSQLYHFYKNDKVKLIDMQSLDFTGQGHELVFSPFLVWGFEYKFTIARQIKCKEGEGKC